VDMGLVVDETDARGPTLLGDHGEAAAAGPEEVDGTGFQCEYCRKRFPGFKMCPRMIERLFRLDLRFLAPAH
jgi:hypothetical protein